MIKIAHEAPISIMEDVKSYTDYDYALVHLFETHPEYYNSFKKSLEEGREVILDNSIFELGESFDPDRYADWIKKLKPTEYIIPDVLEDTSGTIMSAIKWMNKYRDLPGKKIAVVHGKNMEDFIYCYNRLLDLGVDKIAFTFRGHLYENESLGSVKPLDHRIKLMSWALGRIRVMDKLVGEDVIDKEVPHHLLGCSLPQEFLHYLNEDFSWIESIDTSNPVTMGLDYKNYDSKGGCSFKPEAILFERIDEKVDAGKLHFIISNILSFRNLLKQRIV